MHNILSHKGFLKRSIRFNAHRFQAIGGIQIVLFSLVATSLSAIPERLLPTEVIRFREVLKRTGLNRADYETNERGYYEALLETNRSLAAVAQTPNEPTPEVMNMHLAEMASRPVMNTNDIREYILKPSVATFAYGTRWETNSLGLRDREYPKDKPESTLRIALLGDSIACGWGVTRNERFEELWETRLNQETGDGQSVEVWNFSVPGHSPGARWKHFETAGKDTGFDLMVYEATTSDPGWDAHRLAYLLTKGLGADDPLYAETLNKTGVQATASRSENRDALLPWSWTIVEGVYHHIVESCHKRGLPVAFVLIPRVGANLTKVEKKGLLAMADSSGFDLVVDLSDVYDGQIEDDLAIAPGDYHPNVLGHQLIASRWADQLAQWPELQRRLKTSGKAP